jgi:signal transduction histidine kinase
MAPRSVEEMGIETAIRNLCQQVESTTGIKVSFSYTGHANTAGNNILATTYRIVQEALNNVIRHSHASKARVELNQDTEKIELMIEDNGHGFDEAKIDINKTSGLRNIKERISIVGGNFQIINDGQNGTRLLIHLPI